VVPLVGLWSLVVEPSGIALQALLPARPFGSRCPDSSWSCRSLSARTLRAHKPSDSPSVPTSLTCVVSLASAAAECRRCGATHILLFRCLRRCGPSAVPRPSRPRSPGAQVSIIADVWERGRLPSGRAGDDTTMASAAGDVGEVRACDGQVARPLLGYDLLLLDDREVEDARGKLEPGVRQGSEYQMAPAERGI